MLLLCCTPASALPQVKVSGRSPDVSGFRLANLSMEIPGQSTGSSHNGLKRLSWHWTTSPARAGSNQSVFCCLSVRERNPWIIWG